LLNTIFLKLFRALNIQNSLILIEEYFADRLRVSYMIAPAISDAPGVLSACRPESCVPVLIRFTSRYDRCGKVANINIVVSVASIDVAIGSTEGKSGDGENGEKSGGKMHGDDGTIDLAKGRGRRVASAGEIAREVGRLFGQEMHRFPREIPTYILGAVVS
jgi:hypothetical protein